MILSYDSAPATATPTCHSAAVWILLAIACVTASEPLDPACIDVCEELVGVCAVAAFPDKSSCEDGCRFALQEGVDGAAYALCVEQAACDPFALVECEHTYGLE